MPTTYPLGTLRSMFGPTRARVKAAERGSETPEPPPQADSSHVDTTPPRFRIASRAHAVSLARFRRALHRVVDPRQDGRPGRARQRRAPGPLRRLVAAADLADRRLPRA